MKKCRKCSAEKEDSEFHKSSREKDGLQSWCKSCNKKARMATYYKDPSIQRNRSRLTLNRNRKYVYEYLLTHPCVDCGNVNPVVLTFDHIRDKFMNVSDMVKNEFSLKKIQAEIDKCEVRCCNCHAIKTAERGNWWITSQSSSPKQLYSRK